MSKEHNIGIEESKINADYREASLEIENLVDFNEAKVEPLNFTRKNLLEDDDCLSYL